MLPPQNTGFGAFPLCLFSGENSSGLGCFFHIILSFCVSPSVQESRVNFQPRDHTHSSITFLYKSLNLYVYSFFRNQPIHIFVCSSTYPFPHPSTLPHPRIHLSIPSFMPPTVTEHDRELQALKRHLNLSKYWTS